MAGTLTKDPRRPMRMRALLGLVYGALLRGLSAIGGAVAGYGATGMFTSSGLTPPNAVVIAGVALLALAAAALVRAERRGTGLWPALLIVGLPFTLYALTSLAQPECTQPHPPLTSSFTCAPVGSHALAVVAPLVAAAGTALMVLDLRALARSLRPGAE